jgi:hypothetical protein
MADNDNYILSKEEAEILFADVKVLLNIEDLEGLKIEKIIHQRIETEGDEDSVSACQIIVLRATNKNNKTSTYVYCDDVSSWGGYELCEGSAIKLRSVGTSAHQKYEVYWDVKKHDPTALYFYNSLNLAAVKKAAEWGIVRYGIISIAENYLNKIKEMEEKVKVKRLQEQIVSAQKELDELKKMEKVK